MAEGGIGYTESEAESVPRHSSPYSRHSRKYLESVSLEICTIMNRLGYSDEIRRRRVEKYRELGTLWNARTSNITSIIAGSKAEGLTCLMESDFDMLIVMNSVLCVEAGINLQNISLDIDLLRMDTSVYPGHCILLLVRQGSINCVQLYNALCENGYGHALLSSSLFLDECSKLKFPVDLRFLAHERAGPSIPTTLYALPTTLYALLHTDRVYALRCLCPSILNRWASRPRHWPSPVIVQKVVSLGGFLTPVGFKLSENKHMEWRICFNTGEAELVNNLNGTQAKVYVILKMILKDILKPTKKEITSYILKNIVLWQGERSPQTQFHACSLLHWLHDGLIELRNAIAKKHLPYYMIPERNLMAACGINDLLQRKWLSDITETLEEGPRVILRLEKIQKAIVASPRADAMVQQEKDGDRDTVSGVLQPILAVL